MKRIYHTGSNITLQRGAVLSGRLFLFPELHGYENNGNMKREAHTAIDRPKNYRAKLANAPFGRQGRALQVSRKNHPHCVPVFFPKTLPYREHLPYSPCSSTGCQSPSIHKLNDKVMNQAIISRPPTAPMQIRMPMPATRRKKAVEPNPAVKFPPRGSGPVHISTLLNPILEICRHPDRDRLLAELFSDM